MSTPLAGIELVFWNLGTEAPPTVSFTRSALSDNSLNRERAAEVPESTAFRRAVDTLAEKEIRARVWTRKADNTLCAQLDREYEQDGHLARERLGVYGLVNDRPETLEGKDFDGLRDAYSTARETYTRADLSKVVKEILDKDGLGAYSPRKGGGVYFVPVRPDASDLLDRLERFSSAVGVRFLRYTIPDTGAQREEITDAVADSISADLDAHAEAIAAYHGETKAGIVTNRELAIAVTETLIARLRHLILPRVHGLTERIATLRAGCAAAQETIAAHKHAEGVQRGPRRQILGILPESAPTSAPAPSAEQRTFAEVG